MTRIETDILIIGGGIAGPALAAALSEQNFGVVLLERSAEPLDTARGDHLQPRTVEILESWGALANIRSKGAEKRDGTIWYDSNGKPLLNALVTDLDIPHPYFLYLNHELISSALLDTAARSANFKMFKPIRDWNIETQTATSARVIVKLTDESTVTVDCRIVVGADGRNSRVRKVADIEADSWRYERPINVLFGEFTERPAGNCLGAYLGEQGILALIPRTGGGCKLGVSSSAREVGFWRAAADSELLESIDGLARDLPISDIKYGGVYPPIRLTTMQWIKDNTVLLGDACHAMHPAQSQGMNLTIRCADKLAHALSQSKNALNESLSAYERATKPAIDAILEENHRAGLLFDSTDGSQLSKFAESLRQIEVSPDAQRNYAMRGAGYASSI